MSSYLNLADIASRLHSLEDIEKSLQKLITDIQVAKKKGEAWLQTRDASTYREIKEFLVGSTGEILKTCLTLGSQRLNHSSETITLETVDDDKSATVSTCEDFLCIKTGQSYVPCEENCTHIIGQHEQVVTEDNVVDVQKHLADCIKNPGHSKFIPVDIFSVDHLPESCRNSYLHAYIKSLADLTVKVSVTMTSPERPKFWPGTKVPFFLYDMRGSQQLRTGSGRVSKVTHYTSTCSCQKCFSSNDWRSEWWEVEVLTAANLVFDNVEASHTTVRLFYDKEDSPEVTLCGDASVIRVNINSDTSELRFVTCNENLGKKIVDTFMQHESVRTQLYQNYRDIYSLKDRFMWIVSHPHGGSKQISLGTRKYEYWYHRNLQDNYKSIYTACTCPGSSGAPIDGISFRLNVHSGCLKSGLSYSCVM